LNGRPEADVLPLKSFSDAPRATANGAQLFALCQGDYECTIPEDDEDVIA
jgi:hypothetical protein